MCMHKSEGSLREYVLSFHHMGLEDALRPCQQAPLPAKPAHLPTLLKLFTGRSCLTSWFLLLCNFIGVGRPSVLVPEHGKLAHAEFSRH